MPAYHNATDRELSFVINGYRFTLKPGDECEIERSREYVVKARGLPLTKGRAPTPGAPEVEPVREVVPALRLPDGVENGAAGEDVDDDDDGDEDAPSDEVSAVAKQLAAQGVKLPGKRRR